MKGANFTTSFFVIRMKIIPKTTAIKHTIIDTKNG